MLGIVFLLLLKRDLILIKHSTKYFLYILAGVGAATQDSGLGKGTIVLGIIFLLKRNLILMKCATKYFLYILAGVGAVTQDWRLGTGTNVTIVLGIIFLLFLKRNLI